MLGLHGQTHFELEHLIDLTRFDDIQIDIWKGMSLSKNIAIPAQFKNPTPSEYKSYEFTDVKPVFTAYSEFCSLPNDSRLKQIGLELQEQDPAAFSEFIKYAYGAHDHYTLYNLLSNNPGWYLNATPVTTTKVAENFIPLIQWINSLVGNVFTHIGRAYLISLDSYGISFEHRDGPADLEYTGNCEFIHIRPNLKRPFYIYDTETKQKHYIRSRVAWFNDKDTHGGDISASPTYAVRIDGMFTNEFRKKILT